MLKVSAYARMMLVERRRGCGALMVDGLLQGQLHY